MGNNRRRLNCMGCAKLFPVDGDDKVKYRFQYDHMEFTVCSLDCAIKTLKAYWGPGSITKDNLKPANYPGRTLL